VLLAPCCYWLLCDNGPLVFIHITSATTPPTSTKKHSQKIQQRRVCCDCLRLCWSSQESLRNLVSQRSKSSLRGSPLRLLENWSCVGGLRRDSTLFVSVSGDREAPPEGRISNVGHCLGSRFTFKGIDRGLVVVVVFLSDCVLRGDRRLNSKEWTQSTRMSEAYKALPSWTICREETSLREGKGADAICRFQQQQQQSVVEIEGLSVCLSVCRFFSALLNLPIACFMMV
jgi:hypothetical protein